MIRIQKKKNKITKVSLLRYKRIADWTTIAVNYINDAADV